MKDTQYAFIPPCGLNPQAMTFYLRALSHWDWIPGIQSNGGSTILVFRGMQWRCSTTAASFPWCQTAFPFFLYFLSQVTVHADSIIVVKNSHFLIAAVSLCSQNFTKHIYMGVYVKSEEIKKPLKSHLRTPLQFFFWIKSDFSTCISIWVA